MLGSKPAFVTMEIQLPFVIWMGYISRKADALLAESTSESKLGTREMVFGLGESMAFYQGISFILQW